MFCQLYFNKAGNNQEISCGENKMLFYIKTNRQMSATCHTFLR